MAVWLVLCALLSVSQCQGVTEVPVSVTRRGEGDRVSLSSSGSSSCVIRDCPPLNSSYLVEEMQCVQDTMLQNSTLAAWLHNICVLTNWQTVARRVSLTLYINFTLPISTSHLDWRRDST